MKQYLVKANVLLTCIKHIKILVYYRCILDLAILS